MKANGITVIRDETYFQNHYNRDKKLSLKAKGLLGLVISLPPSWDFSIRGIASICKETKDTINAITKELIAQGYCRMEEVRDNGKFSGYHWYFYELKQALPHPKSYDPVKPYPKKPDRVKPDTVFYDTSNKEVLKEGLKKGGGVNTTPASSGTEIKTPPPLSPPVLVWLERMGIDIPAIGAEMIVKRVSNLTAWEDTLDGWLASGWSKNNIDGQINRYDKKLREGDYPEEQVPQGEGKEENKGDDYKDLIFS